MHVGPDLLWWVDSERFMLYLKGLKFDRLYNVNTRPKLGQQNGLRISGSASADESRVEVETKKKGRVFRVT